MRISSRRVRGSRRVWRRLWRRCGRNIRRGAWRLAESAHPSRASGQPLVMAHDPIFYRTKAAYVFWMLRGIVGDKPLMAALEQYDAAQDKSSDSFEHVLERTRGQ